MNSTLPVVQRGGKKKENSQRFSALKTHLGHEWAFYDTSVLSVACGPSVVHCTVSGREGLNGRVGSH